MSADSIERAFPSADIRTTLEGWWLVEKEEFQLLVDDTPPKSPFSVLTPLTEIDSHRAVRALLEIEPIVGFEVPPRVVKLGGYNSFQEMVDHLISELSKIYRENQEKVDA